MEVPDSGKGDNKAAEKFSSFVSEQFYPELEKTRLLLTPLRLKEGALFEKTAKEKQVLDEIQSRSDLQNLLSSIQVYQKKLVKIKANMRNLHERSTKLKKRALLLEQSVGGPT